jgi:hypothetical protein
MSTYTPERWVVVEIKSGAQSVRKVLASWYGGYTGSDSWKLSSGITSVINNEHTFDFHNVSGSVYSCDKKSYGMSGYTTGIYSTFESANTDEINIRILDEKEIELSSVESSI